MNLLYRGLRRMAADRQKSAALCRDIAVATEEIRDAKMLFAKLLIRRMATTETVVDLSDVEFCVSSQFGEDGIIQYLIRRAGVPQEAHTFVEFGVENYHEANTRFLLMNDNWRGLIMDSSEANMAAVRASTAYWKYDLTAQAAFINRDNINDIINQAGFAGEIGLLSIDIDGNDYWVWERIAAVDPIIVIVEYNSLFGARRAVAVPYDAAFERGRAHYSHLYWGSSLRALEMLAARKGYALVGSNSAGNNAFFVRKDHLNGQSAVPAWKAYREARFRESRDAAGRFTFLAGKQRLVPIADMPLIDVESNETITVRELMQDDVAVASSLRNRRAGRF